MGGGREVAKPRKMWPVDKPAMAISLFLAERKQELAALVPPPHASRHTQEVQNRRKRLHAQVSDAPRVALPSAYATYAYYSGVHTARLTTIPRRAPSGLTLRRPLSRHASHSWSRSRYSPSAAGTDPNPHPNPSPNPKLAGPRPQRLVATARYSPTHDLLLTTGHRPRRMEAAPARPQRLPTARLGIAAAPAAPAALCRPSRSAPLLAAHPAQEVCPARAGASPAAARHVASGCGGCGEWGVARAAAAAATASGRGGRRGGGGGGGGGSGGAGGGGGGYGGRRRRQRRRSACRGVRRASTRAPLAACGGGRWRARARGGSRHAERGALHRRLHGVPYGVPCPGAEAGEARIYGYDRRGSTAHGGGRLLHYGPGSGGRGLGCGAQEVRPHPCFHTLITHPPPHPPLHASPCPLGVPPCLTGPLPLPGTCT